MAAASPERRRAMTELLADPRRVNRLIAAAADTSTGLARLARVHLEALGAIPRWRGEQRPPRDRYALRLPPPATRSRLAARAAAMRRDFGPTPRFEPLPVTWTPDRDGRDGPPASGLRCPERGCEVRWRGGQDRLCPDHDGSGDGDDDLLAAPALSLMGVAAGPDLRGGLCVPGNSAPSRYGAGAWDGRDPAGAVRLCRQCPVLMRCRSWILSQPVLSGDMTVVGGLTGYERAQLARGEKPVPAHRAAVRTTERAGGTPVKITTIGCDLCSELVPQDETWSVSGIDVCPSCQQRPIADLIPLIEAKRQAQRDKSAANRARYYAAARPRAQGA